MIIFYGPLDFRVTRVIVIMLKYKGGFCTLRYSVGYWCNMCKFGGDCWWLGVLVLLVFSGYSKLFGVLCVCWVIWGAGEERVMVVWLMSICGTWCAGGPWRFWGAGD